MKKPSVLFIVNHAADYHEPFFGRLAALTQLTVLARNCESENLVSPEKRGDYVFIESNRVGLNSLFFQRRILRETCSGNYDFVVCVLNLRNLSVILAFIVSQLRPKGNFKWIWCGIVFGERDNRIEDFVRGKLLSLGDLILVHSDQVKRKIAKKFQLESTSYNNSNSCIDDFKAVDQHWNYGQLKVVFVGTNKPRKNLNALIRLAQNIGWLQVRLVGSGMSSLEIMARDLNLKNVSFFEHATGTELNQHFEWSNLVVAPGNVGLLASSASRYGRAVVYDAGSYHGPEVELLVGAGQISLDFSDLAGVEAKLYELRDNKGRIDELGAQLYSLGSSDYTVEHMVHVHQKAFDAV